MLRARFHLSGSHLWHGRLSEQRVANVGTVAVLDHVGGLIERVSYDPYGRGRHHWPADVDGDWDQSSTGA